MIFSFTYIHYLGRPFYKYKLQMLKLCEILLHFCLEVYALAMLVVKFLVVQNIHMMADADRIFE
jgi:hypothetical protein